MLFFEAWDECAVVVLLALHTSHNLKDQVLVITIIIASIFEAP